MTERTCMGGDELRIFLLYSVGHTFAPLNFAFQILSSGLLTFKYNSLCNVIIDTVLFWSTSFSVLSQFCFSVPPCLGRETPL